MQIIRQRAYARAGLMGNPSDGYNGRTISFIVRNFYAEVVLYEWPKVEIVQTQDDQGSFDSIADLHQDVVLHGYYGGVRLVKATIKRFFEYCQLRGWQLHGRNFAVRYSTCVPRAVGLAGSSAIIVATLRALMEFYSVEIPLEIQPSLVLSVETMELGIAAGLQDRVIQVYEGLMFMDFSRELMTTVDGLQHGVYERLDPSLLPPVYIAYSLDAGEPTYVVHNPLRARFARGDADVVNAMQTFAALTLEAKAAILTRDHSRLHELINRNFDTRASICTIASPHLAMIQAARSVGASAKFAGSGGAIVGTYRDAAMFDQLKQVLGTLNCRVIQPQILPASH